MRSGITPLRSALGLCAVTTLAFLGGVPALARAAAVLLFFGALWFLLTRMLMVLAVAAFGARLLPPP